MYPFAEVLCYRKSPEEGHNKRRCAVLQVKKIDRRLKACLAVLAKASSADLQPDANTRHRSLAAAMQKRFMEDRGNNRGITYIEEPACKRTKLVDGGA